METQDSIGRWAGETFPGGDDMSPRHYIRLLEEVIELCAAAGATWIAIENAATAAITRSFTGGEIIPGPEGSGIADLVKPDPGGVPDEMADAAILLAVAAHKRGVDLQAKVDKKMAINRARRWESRGDGTGYHIKENQ